jgi:hypothetical protein
LADVRLAQPTRGCIDPFGNFIFADQQNSVIRRVTPGGHSDVIGGRAQVWFKITNSSIFAFSYVLCVVFLQHTGKVDGDASRARFYCTGFTFISGFISIVRLNLMLYLNRAVVGGRFASGCRRLCAASQRHQILYFLIFRVCFAASRR